MRRYKSIFAWFEGQELRSLIRAFIEQEGLSVHVTRSTSNGELLDMIYDEIMGPEPDNKGEETSEGDDTPQEDEPQPEERTERPRRRR